MENQRPSSAEGGKRLLSNDDVDGTKQKRKTTPPERESSTESEEPKRRRLAEVIADCNARWFEESLEEATNGDLDMMVIVAQMYYHGYGVPLNIAKAYLWISKAAKEDIDVWNVIRKRPGYRECDSDTG